VSEGYDLPYANRRFGAARRCLAVSDVELRDRFCQAWVQSCVPLVSDPLRPAPLEVVMEMEGFWERVGGGMSIDTASVDDLRTWSGELVRVADVVANATTEHWRQSAEERHDLN
jgi:hypothetical protein